MNYIRVFWRHNNPGNPVELWSELDEGRNEIRKIYIFSDGSMQVASENFSTGEIILGLEPVPENEEINRELEFDAKDMDEAEFEKIWRLAMLKH